MLSPDKNLFVSLPDGSATVTLHPATVVSIEHDLHTAELEEEDLPLEADQEVFIYFELNRTFMKQSARIESVLAGDPKLSIRFQTTGAPVSAEQRQCLRVPVAFKQLTAQIGPEESCPLLDVSETGFSVFASEDYDMGRVVDVSLRYGVETFSGRVCVQSIKNVGEGRKRYGFYCVDKRIAPGSLPRGLYVISMAAQREHLSGLRR